MSGRYRCVQTLNSAQTSVLALRAGNDAFAGSIVPPGLYRPFRMSRCSKRIIGKLGLIVVRHQSIWRWRMSNPR